jgi:hypothetical protein
MARRYGNDARDLAVEAYGAPDAAVEADGSPDDAVEGARNARPPFEVAVDCDRPDRVYEAGEEVLIYVTSEKRGHLLVEMLETGSRPISLSDAYEALRVQVPAYVQATFGVEQTPVLIPDHCPGPQDNPLFRFTRSQNRSRSTTARTCLPRAINS